MDLGTILGNSVNTLAAAGTQSLVRRFFEDDPDSGIIDRTTAVLDGNPNTTFSSPTGTVVEDASCRPKAPPGFKYVKLANGDYGLVRSTRRRRRKLLTKSDLGDIAALKGIVGSGKHFEQILSTAMFRAR